MKVKIPFISWTGKAALGIEIPKGTEKFLHLRVALEVSVKSGADLSGAYLSRADLSGADLSGAYLSGAYLSRADLSGADLSGAYLSGAYLSGADLSGADLSGAYLSGAYLSGAYLSRADLSRAYLSGADLSRADLSRAYLSRAYLSGADLSGADLGKNQKCTIPPLFIIGGRWPVMITDHHIKIGCEVRTTREWAATSRKTVEQLDTSPGGALWATWKETIVQVARTHQTAAAAEAARDKPKTEVEAA